MVTLVISIALIDILKIIQHSILHALKLQVTLPNSQLVPVHPGAHVQTSGKVHVPPF